jgi:hypothetical protein
MTLMLIKKQKNKSVILIQLRFTFKGTRDSAHHYNSIKFQKIKVIIQFFSQERS